MKFRHLALFALLAPLVLSPATATQPDTSTPAPLDQVKRPAGALLVPEHFMRQWDPVTVFFDGEAGPAKGGPEDHPERLVQMSPSHPGAFTWLDSHTLQFRPATAWPPMGRFTWTVQGHKAELVTLMSAPQSSVPANGATGLDPVETISLRFAEPIAAADLARLVTIELRPLPGVGGEQSRWLDSHDFDVMAQERQAPNAPAGYVLTLHAPVPWGTKAIVHVRLSPDPAKGAEEQTLSFSTAEPFHAVSFGCRDKGFPALPEGAVYGPERALTCPADERVVQVTFSDRLSPVGPIEARNLLRFSPQVEGLSFKTVENTLVASGRFQSDTLYQLRLEPAKLKDNRGRPLLLNNASQLSLSFPARPGFVEWQKGDGIAERYGPQMLPVKARAVERVDLRIFAVDPLARSLWPFPDKGVRIDETQRPPAPGEETKRNDAPREPDASDVAGYIRSFGSPIVSELVDLPAGKSDATASFGIDVRQLLAHAVGAGKPGHYLIGIRRLDGKPERQWMRLQITDLSLTAVDEKDHVRFAVTSLASGQPVAGAKVTIEAKERGSTVEIGAGVTGADGMIDWTVPPKPDSFRTLSRVIVRKDDDLLVLDPHDHAPREYAEGGWREQDRTETRSTDDYQYYNSASWLDWVLRDTQDRGTPPKNLCHIFTERPIYRPDDAVHIKGYVRRYIDGRLELGKPEGTLVVEGPDGAKWRWPLEINEYGSFYHKFDDKTVATGIYKAYVEFKKPAGQEDDASEEDNSADSSGDNASAENAGQPHCHFVRFKKEAYRLPKFEVQLQAPMSAGLDAPFPVGLTAEYFAGGMVAARPLHWRVTQVPFTWLPKPQPGFVFSVDQRFSGNQPFRSSPILERDDRTDAHGGARLTLDPTIEPTAQPRKYMVEATVVGDDDQTVTNSQEILALPPFVLGVKVPRFIEHGDKIEPQVLVEDAQGKPLAGQKVTVRLIRRQWNSILQASDFTQGQAKYVTEVIEDKVGETTITSESSPSKLSFPIQGAAVYVVEVESQDKLGRLQTVKVDLFAGGDRPATWSRPPAEVFSVAPEKDAYAPGDTAKLVLQSPFQTGQALAIVEEPDGHNRYQWVPVANGYGTFTLPIKPEYLPRVAVHFVLMRGRLKGDDSEQTPHADLRKPATLAATQWVTVTPVKNIVKVDLTYPRKALPGQDVDLTVKLSDDQGKPLSGEVTLWMVDQAVLALAREAKLDPLPQFIVPRSSKTTLRDTRNMAFGLLPLQEEPGGDEGDDGSPLLRATVRKNFTPVPYYNPDLHVGPDGVVTVKVHLPDSLTNFKIRAKAVSGPSRFGYGTGDMQLRLPVIVQPALPRFVRPGDSFELAAIGRLVEGDGGPGRAQVKVDGLDLAGPDQQPADWVADKPSRFAFLVKVPTPVGDGDKPAPDSVGVTMAVERTADAARDAFEVRLPILPDRDPVVERSLLPLAAGQPVSLPGIPEAIRPGSLKRDALIASRDLALLAGGLDYLRRYPFGCTEQRISEARADIAALRFGSALTGKSESEHAAQTVKETQAWITGVLDENGLAAYWPGGQGYVTVTAWALQFLTEAQAAGLPVDNGLRDKLTQALKQSLRSDYRAFLDGQSWTERTWALTALTAAGQGDSAYGAELARKSQFLTAESQAQVVWALARGKSAPTDVLADLQKTLWAGVITKLDHGQEVYGGLQQNGSPSAVILPSETRTLAQMLRATMAAAPDDPRNHLLTDALLQLGQGNGWGDTNANAEAMLALADGVKAQASKDPRKVDLAFGDDKRSLTLAGDLPAALLALPPQAGSVSLAEGAGKPLAVLLRSSYLPQADGAHAASSAHGFAVERDLAVIAKDGSVARRITLDKPASEVALAVGDVVEDHGVVVNATDRAHVAVVLPLAAGLEPLNPHLATAPPEAKPSEEPTLKPSYVAVLDDRVMYFYDQLPKGTYHFRMRLKATVPGRFIQPPAMARAMYDDSVNGSGNGAVVAVSRQEQ